MTKEHKHAHLLRLAADNADQLFECGTDVNPVTIEDVLNYPHIDWRPVKPAPSNTEVKE